MSVEKQYVHLVLSDGDKYTDYIAAEGMLRDFEFIEEDKFRVNGDIYYEGIILCRGKSKVELRRLVKKNRKAIPIFRFRPFPSPKSSNDQVINLDNVRKQTSRQISKITQLIETEPNSLMNKNVFFTNPGMHSVPEAQNQKKTISDKDSVNGKSTAADIEMKISQESDKKKFEEDTNKSNIDDATGNSRGLPNYPHCKWYKFKRNIANTYHKAGDGVWSQQGKTSENTGHNQTEEFSVVSLNEQKESKNFISEMIVETPMSVDNDKNTQLVFESAIEQNYNAYEATKFHKQSQVFLQECEEHEFDSNVRSTEWLSDERNSAPTKNRTAPSPLLSHLELTFGTRKRTSERVGLPIHIRKYTQLLTKYEKLDKQYDKMKTINFFLLQYINGVTKDTKELRRHIDMLASPSGYSGENKKSSHRSPFRSIISLSDDESNTDDDLNDV